MDTELDLARASREELLAIIAELKTTNAQLQQRVAALEARLNTRGTPGMPGNKPPSGQQAPRKGPQTAATGLRPDADGSNRTGRACPGGRSGLWDASGRWMGQRTREVIEVPVVPVQVMEHVFVARGCSVCQRRWAPKVALNKVVVGQQRLGVNLVSLLVTLREEGRLPLRTIQWYLKTVYQLHLSVGAIVRAIYRVAQQAQLAVAEVLERIRASPVVHADETGWRQDGVNGYIWTFSTPTERHSLRRGRHKEVVDGVLDESFSGVLVSGFYATYHHYPGLKRRCWAQLLWDIHELEVWYPEDTRLAQWAAGIRKLYAEAKAFVSLETRQRRRAQLRMQANLLAICRLFLNDPLAVQGKLCRRIERFIKELFVFVADPAVPAENNAAERSLRHLVTSRKISGGTRSAQGTSGKMAFASLFGTWRARGLNPLLECRQLLTSPRV